MKDRLVSTTQVVLIVTWGIVSTIGSAWLCQPALAQQPKRVSDRAHLARQTALLKQLVPTTLRAMGHRNWIAIVDSAYPLQTAPGIKTVYVGGDQLAAVKRVLDGIDKAKHVRGIVYVDKELDYVPPEVAPGIESYRAGLEQLLGKRTVHKQLHEDTIRMLDDASKLFNVLIIKTDLAIPYTSVFVQLDCGYWSEQAERRLRARMKDTKYTPGG